MARRNDQGKAILPLPRLDCTNSEQEYLVTNLVHTQVKNSRNWL